MSALDYQPHPPIDLAREWYLREYGEVKAKAIMYELQYYNLHGQLPADARVIERIEWVGENALTTHRDPDVRSD